MVEIKSGETISIAGLISEEMRNSIDRFPGLGDIPILGILFRSQEFKKRQTELVIFVTPRLARAIDPQKVKLPTEEFVEPNDLEFYLLGRIQGRKPQATERVPSSSLGPDKTGSEGAFGHDL
jgi:pilus assembly protein CpaC